MVRFTKFIPLSAVLAVTLASAQPADDVPSLGFGAKPPVMSLSEVLRTEREKAQEAFSDEYAAGASEDADELLDAPEDEVNEEDNDHEAQDAPSSSVEPTPPAPVVHSAAELPSTTARPGGSSAMRSRLRDQINPAPPELHVDSGINHLIGVAYSHLNRIITPFSNPIVKTTSLATTTVDGSIVYVATNLPEPIGLFIHDETNPDVAISLTLVPAEIPPISTRVHVRGFTGESTSIIRAESSLATAFEQQHTYMDMLKVLMRDLAKGRVPDGYGFRPISGFFADMPGCAMPGIHMVPLQHVIGSSLQVIVSKAHNTSSLMAEIREDACAGPGLRAIAAWPRTTLQPGEATEVYLVLDVPQEIDSGTQRPSLLGGMQ